MKRIFALRNKQKISIICFMERNIRNIRKEIFMLILLMKLREKNIIYTYLLFSVFRPISK